MASELRGLVASMQKLSQRLEATSGAVGNDLAGGTLPRLNEVLHELHNTSHQLNRLLGDLEDSPQSLIFGRPASKPGPGEAGFVTPGK